MVEPALSKWIVENAEKIAASIAMTVATFLVGRFWQGVIRPWIQNFFWQSNKRLSSSYKGEFRQVDAKGEFTKDHTDKVLSDQIELKQNASRVWGTMSVPEGRATSYNFEATMNDGVLRGTFASADPQKESIGSFLLVRKSGSKELKGWCIEPIEGNVIAYEYKWVPKS
ncbi:MAG: hypothetical protein ABI197_04630 [Granulicella sp.]